MRAEPRFAGRAVEFDQPPVQRRLVGAVQPGDRAGDLVVHVADRARDVVAAERLAAVAQVERLAGAGGGAGRRDGAADAAALQQDLGLHRGTAAAVPHAAAVHERDPGVGHAANSFVQAMAHIAEPVDRMGQQRARGASHPVPVCLGGDVLDRRLAIHPGEEQPRQQAGGAGLQRVRRLPRRRGAR